MERRSLSLLTTPYSLPSTRYSLLLPCSLLTLLARSSNLLGYFDLASDVADDEATIVG